MRLEDLISAKGVKKLIVNGKEIQGNAGPLDTPGKEITVEVSLY